MFERFTERARRVVVLAQEEARMLNHNYIGTEHILLGLIHESEGVAAKALESLGLSLEAVRAEVEEIIGRGQAEPTGHIPFTPRAKKVLELSLREALQLGHNYIGTEHILLGVIREGEGVGAQVLRKLGADLNRVRLKVIALLQGDIGSSEGRPPAAQTEPSALLMELAQRGRRAQLLATRICQAINDPSITEQDVILGLLVNPARIRMLEGLAAYPEGLRELISDLMDEVLSEEEPPAPENPGPN